ncbi:MAG: PAS domain S-box protein, partial [Deltaproteobacteria bacterium]|nr:PAS domain S-box protein [Deltaproteobacteria bacterium]
MGNRGHQSPITVNRQPKPRILIVELDEVLCADLAQCLNGWGFEVVGKAVSGRQAVDMALATRPDIVLMAVGLSGDMDGIEAASLIRSEVDSDVIFLVAHSEDAELDRALETEPAAYLTRSISPWQLRATIEIALQTRRTEQRLRTSERQYGTLIETVPQGIIEIDASGHIVFANTTLETMFGYGRHEMTGKRIMDLVPSSTDIRAIQRFLGAAVDRQPSPTPWFGQGLKKDGTVIDLRVDWNYKRNEKGDLVGFMSVLSDMTESIRAQQALKESEERYRTLFEKAGDAIFILEAEGENAGQIVTANQTAAEMHGYSEEELRALRIGQLNAAQDARGVPERLERILKG